MLILERDQNDGKRKTRNPTSAARRAATGQDGSHAISTCLAQADVFLVPEFLNDFRQSSNGSQPEQVGTATLGSWLAFNATLMIAMAYQINWARTTQILSTLTGFLVIAWSLTFTDFKPGIVYFSDVVAVILLLRPSVGAWFKRRSS